MSRDKRVEQDVVARPLMELGTEALIAHLNSRTHQLASEIRTHADEIGCIKTPDGWFVPISYLMSKIEDVADFLHLEALHYGEFEIAGGFEILTSEKESLGISPSSDFRSAVTLAEAIINLRGENQVLVGGQETWRIALHGESLKIQISQISARHGQKEFELPIEQLKSQLTICKGTTARFATALGPLLSKYHDTSISLKQISWAFGLDKFTGKSALS